jgi:hypothetical protein
MILYIDTEFTDLFDADAIIAEKTVQDERCSGFEEEAEARYARIIASGETVLWDDMRNYLKAKIAGESVSAPKSRKIAH